MRPQRVVPAFTAAAALSLVLASAGAAQTDAETRFPTPAGSALVTAVVLNSLDDADTNARIVNTARQYHEEGLEGIPDEPKKERKNKPATGGFTPPATVEGTDAVTEAVVQSANRDEPDILIVSGGDWQSNVAIARRNPTTAILDLNQPPPCLTETGQVDTTGECVGGDTPGNYLAMDFAVEEGAYLAGVVAARESRGRPLGIISGAPECLECDRYVTGFINGARSVEPDIEIEIEYLAADEVAGFSDMAAARTYAEAFIDVYQPGILLPVGRGVSMGMIEAACDAGVRVVGAGVDIGAERPDLRADSCVLISIVPDVARAVVEAMYYYNSSPGAITYDLARGGVRLTDEWQLSSVKRVDTDEFYNEAERAILSGQADPCPDGCGVFLPQPAADLADAG